MEHPWAKLFVGATCNISYTALRHVGHGAKTMCAHWIGQDNRGNPHLGELHRKVGRCANAENTGRAEGDRVTIYLPKFPNKYCHARRCRSAPFTAGSIRVLARLLPTASMTRISARHTRTSDSIGQVLHLNRSSTKPSKPAQPSSRVVSAQTPEPRFAPKELD